MADDWEVETASGRANLFKGGVRVATIYASGRGAGESAKAHAERFAASDRMAALLARIAATELSHEPGSSARDDDATLDAIITEARALLAALPTQPKQESQ